MDKETYTFEDRVYVNPETSRDEQLGFIDKLRGLQQEGAEKIARDTHNLGTDVTPNLGGLNGAEALWSGQYVTPKVESMVSGLRTAAQAQALNDVLSNYQAQMKQRYTNAYRAAQKRGSGGSGGGGTGGDKNEGELEWKTTDTEGVKVGSSHFAGSEVVDKSSTKTYDIVENGKKYGPVTIDRDRNGDITRIQAQGITYDGKYAQNAWNNNFSKRNLVER